MGCTQSKIENEETVTRCKDRKMFMKDAVSFRNAFAAAHSSYAMSLKNTGAALSDFATAELHPHSSSSLGPSSSSALPSSAASQSSYETLPPPPPPLPNFTPPPLHRAASMPEFSIPKPDDHHLKHHIADTIIEEEDEDDDEIENDSHRGSLRHRTSRSSGGSRRGGVPVPDKEASPPRTPPDSDRAPPPPPPQDSTWDYFFPSAENVPRSSLEEVEETPAVSRREEEEVERKAFEERSKRSEFPSGSSGGDESVEDVAAELPPMPPQPPQVPKVVNKKSKQSAPAEGKRTGGKVDSSVTLMQIFDKLDDCFLKASESAHEVSKMLEANRLHYHSNFADNRGHIDHSARVMHVITWNRSFKGLPNNVDFGKDDFDSEENETHATVLDKMLAWEKKLYDEVKAGEQMKLDYQRKVASLNKLKKRGTNIEALEKTKAAVSHLHTRYIVDMQSMDSTVSEINRLRDEQLYPKLVVLVDGMATMWETMQGHHEMQSQIVKALRSLDISQSPRETSEDHRKRTVGLRDVVEDWHSHFGALVNRQKDYIKALNSWLRLNLIPIDNNLKEKVSSPQRPQNPPIQALLHAWHDYLEKLPDELARTAIQNFAAVMNTILQSQEEEMILRKKCDGTRKDWTRRTREFEDWYHKHIQGKTPPDEMDPQRSLDNDLIAEKKSVVELVKKRLEEEEAAYQRMCIQVREKSLASLKLRLPELFRAMSDFSNACAEMYSSLRSFSHPHNLEES